MSVDSARGIQFAVKYSLTVRVDYSRRPAIGDREHSQPSGRSFGRKNEVSNTPLTVLQLQIHQNINLAMYTRHTNSSRKNQRAFPMKVLSAPLRYQGWSASRLYGFLQPTATMSSIIRYDLVLLIMKYTVRKEVIRSTYFLHTDSTQLLRSDIQPFSALISRKKPLEKPL